MNEILESARKLGKQIAGSDRYKTVVSARKAADADETLQADLKMLNQLTTKIAQLEKETKPVEPEDKRRVRELQAQVTRHPKLQELARVEADFAELINHVNRLIRDQLTE